jgi:hypothetical protein
MNDDELRQQLELKKEELRQTFISNIAALDSAILVIKKKGAAEIPELDSSKLRDVILFAIKQAPRQFSIHDIENIVTLHFPDESFPKTSLASSFWKIVTEELKCPIVTPGSGRNPTVYLKGK